MNTACAPHAPVITTHRGPWRRGFGRLQGVLADIAQAWHTSVQRQRRLRALQGLSASTRRDIGLADEWPPAPGGVSPADYERMRW